MSIRVYYSLKKTPTIQALAFTPNLFRVRHYYLLTGCLVGKIPLLESIEIFAKKKANRKFKVQIDTSKYCVHILMYTLPSMSKLDSIGVVLVPGAGHCCGQGKVTSAGAGQSPVRRRDGAETANWFSTAESNDHQIATTLQQQQQHCTCTQHHWGKFNNFLLQILNATIMSLHIIFLSRIYLCNTKSLNSSTDV